jgi:hypothetical protein
MATLMDEPRACVEPFSETPATGQAPFSPPLLSESAPSLYREFWRLWSEERFYDCHEVLEELWRQTAGAERLFYNGLIHCAVAIYQHRRGNQTGAARQLVRARIKLARFAPFHGGVDIEALLAAVENAVQGSLQALDTRQRVQLGRLQQGLEKRIMEEFPSEPASDGI